MQLIDIAMTGLESALLALSVYTVSVGLAGLRRRKSSKIAAPQKRFALITAAHNEETVIAPHIESLLALDYPRELVDIYILCDNCTDATVKIARRYGVRTLERTDRVQKGKGFALEWAFGRLLGEPAQYDAFCVFDADNLVSPNYLNVMNTALLNGAKAVQGYLDSKNPWDTWVSACYSVAYFSTNRVWQLARHNLGLSAALGGTGMCLDTQVLKQLGWGATSLTEDLEYTAKLVMGGMRTEWAHDARVYDEKPTQFRQTVHQRMRWLQGHWNVAFRYAGPLLRRFWETKEWRCLDEVIYLLQPFFITVWTVVASLSLVNTFLDGVLYTSPLEHIPGFGWLFFAVITFVYPMLGLIADRAPAKSYLYYLLYLLFGFTWIPIAWVAFFKRNNTDWSHTLHTRAIRLEEISSEGQVAASN